MSVQGIHKHMTDQYPKEIHDIQKQVSDSDPVASDDRLSKIFASRTYDEYIPGKEPEAIGLYKVLSDENGNRKIQFDDPMTKVIDNSLPKQVEGSSNEATPSENEPDRKTEKCTTNTDKVDREIEDLKEKKEQLEQQIRATEDPKKLEKLEHQLDQVESELRRKNNDTYRRQNAVIS